jgi:hypothetical protein
MLDHSRLTFKVHRSITEATLKFPWIHMGWSRHTAWTGHALTRVTREFRRGGINAPKDMPHDRFMTYFGFETDLPRKIKPPIV